MEIKIAILAVLMFILLCVLAAFSKHDVKKLELVQVIFRHGERTVQIEEYEVFHYTDKSVYEPFGMGQLTNTGKYQAYNIGLMLRDRYKDFLNEKYNSDDVYAYSTSAHRTETTLQLVLAGLYPPTKDLEWNPNLKWIPVPYNYIPLELDVLLMPFLSKKFTKLYREVTDPISRAKEKSEYSDIIQLLKEKTGFVYKSDVPGDLGTVHNVLYIHEHMNITLPDWYTEELKPRIRDMVVFRLDCMSYTQELKRINGGAMIRKFLENMNVDGTQYNPRKIYLYSGHELNLAAVARTLGLAAFEFPSFASALIFEKWRDTNDRIYVRIVGWDGTNRKLTVKKLDKCDEYCFIEDFMNITRDVIPSDREMNYLLDDFKGSVVFDSLLRDSVVKTSIEQGKQIFHSYF